MMLHAGPFGPALSTFAIQYDFDDVIQITRGDFNG